ncbi:uncharacterized protein A4U43_C02F3900 [Asparagus officinalis]|uniref:X8 domain-containing protein n=1 Tax=Asparagus officinalis TaxID=4686 RepID=A0A5P1FFP5_ASPOF|nr:uncharacterized protein A4U43_C02F3900 [Asparagus officinalis]
MGSPPVRLAPVLLLLLLLLLTSAVVDGAQWCIASSEASDRALQAALDYACGPGSADCQPIQPSGLCYLPNTMQAHASYAFNSFYQRSRGAPGACDFGGVATITITDPSYGACTFPSSASSAGGPRTPTTSTSPNTNTPNSSGIGGDTTGTGIGGLTPVGGLTPGNGLTPNTGFNSGFSPTLPNTDDISDI